MSLNCCPSCGFNKQSGLFTGSHFYVYKCDKCYKLFCYECEGSNGGRHCPDCDSTSFSKYDTVYLE